MQKRAFLRSLGLCIVLTLSICGLVTNGSAKDALIFFAVNYPPYDIENDSSGKRGFDVEVVEAAFASVGINTEVQFRPWKRIMSEVESGKATGAVTCSDVQARRSWVYLSDKLSVTRLAIVVGKSNEPKNILTVNDLKQLNTVAVNGYASEKELTKLGIEHVKTNTIESALKMVTYRDSIHAFYGGWESTQFVASTMGIQEKLTFLPDTSKTPHPFYVCFSQKWPNVKTIIEQFNKGLNKIRQEGLYETIHTRYK
ncbi:MAG: transporter substrate-binding domain-containing protein [Sneathiella sp.]|nr:transporter substrate-binding domain-containing protein [Sneathiella sp.]